LTARDQGEVLRPEIATSGVWGAQMLTVELIQLPSADNGYRPNDRELTFTLNTIPGEIPLVQINALMFRG
jgi:hypothetical protein